MINHFNSNVAKSYGVNVAIFVQQLAQWSFINLANTHNLHDGHVWSYNKLEAYDQFFPYWTKNQIEVVIKKAVDCGLVIKGNYNKHKYDRTCWYALTHEGMRFYPELLSDINLEALYSTISEKTEMLFGDFRNAVRGYPTPIPTNNTTKDEYNRHEEKEDEPPERVENKKCAKASDSETLKMLQADNPYNLDEETLKDWIKVRKNKRALITKTGWAGISKELGKCQQLGMDPRECFLIAVTAGWQSFKAAWFLEKEIVKKSRSNKKVYL